ncbi:MAG TPA: TOBE domain-containing protein [Gemmatimonadota bacterium]
MRRQLSTYLDPDANPADRKLLSVLRREARGKRSLSRAVYDALLEYYGLASEAGTAAVLPGMENVYAGRIVGQRDGLATVDLTGLRVQSASLLPARTNVFVSIRAHSIAIQTGPGSGRTSVRNALEARIRRVLALEEIAYVDCLAGPFPMRAAVTPRSVKELDLAAGRHVVLAFKALSVKLTPR